MDAQNWSTDANSPMVIPSANSTGSAFSAAVSPVSHNPSNVAIVPDANGLLPGQTKFYSPPPAAPGVTDPNALVPGNDAFVSEAAAAPTYSEVAPSALPAILGAPANFLGMGGENSGGRGSQSPQGK